MRLKYSIPFLFTFIYLVFPTNNSGIDGYAYAASIQWGKDLVWPHHLLYCYLGYWLHVFIPFIEPLELMKIINAISGGAALLIFQTILKRLEIYNASYFVVFVAASFGFMRFATENETYILPILFSLSGTLYYLRFVQSAKGSQLLFSGILFGVAVLFHQIHALWYLGFVIAFWFIRPALHWKNQLVFIGSGGLLVSVGYVLVYKLSDVASGISFVQFILSDVYAGRVQTGITLSNFIMTPVSFVRTFIQVHGYMWQMFTENPGLIVLPVSMLIILVVGIKTLLKHSKARVSKYPLFIKALFISFILQFCFAFYSVGNAEFMVMLPFLMVLWLVCKFNLTTKPILYIAIVMLFWNLVFGLAPARFLDLDGSKQILKGVEKNPHVIWVLKEPQKVENMADYYNNQTLDETILREDELRTYLDKHKIKGRPQLIYTDILESREGVNRQGLLSNNDSSSAFEGLRGIPTDTIYFFGGQRIISKLEQIE